MNKSATKQGINMTLEVQSENQASTRLIRLLSAINMLLIIMLVIVFSGWYYYGTQYIKVTSEQTVMSYCSEKSITSKDCELILSYAREQ